MVLFQKTNEEQNKSPKMQELKIYKLETKSHPDNQQKHNRLEMFSEVYKDKTC